MPPLKARAASPLERIDEIPYMVIKKDGRREKRSSAQDFARIAERCELKKTDPVTHAPNRIHRGMKQGVVHRSHRTGTGHTEIGENDHASLKKMTKVHVRFASVLHDSRLFQEFSPKLKNLMKERACQEVHMTLHLCHNEWGGNVGAPTFKVLLEGFYI